MQNMNRAMFMNNTTDFLSGALRISDAGSVKSELSRGVSITNDANLQILLDDPEQTMKA